MTPLKMLSSIDEAVVIAAVCVAVFYAPFAKSWLKAIVVVLAISILSSALGLLQITLAADGAKNILACFVFPLLSLGIAIILRSLKQFFRFLFMRRRQP